MSEESPQLVGTGLDLSQLVGTSGSRNWSQQVGTSRSKSELIGIPEVSEGSALGPYISKSGACRLYLSGTGRLFNTSDSLDPQRIPGFSDFLNMLMFKKVSAMWGLWVGCNGMEMAMGFKCLDSQLTHSCMSPFSTIFIMSGECSVVRCLFRTVPEPLKMLWCCLGGS